MFKSWRILSLTLIALLPVQSLFADAKSDYQASWSAREQKATTSAERIKLANDLMDKANETATGRKAGSGDSLAKSQHALESLRDSKRDDVMILCEKAYEFGSRQRDSYAAAARALGIIQILDPARRLDSLLKLQKMYDDVYQSTSSRNVGIAKGLAEVLLQVGDEKRRNLHKGAIQGTSEIAGEVAAIKAVNGIYSRGLEVIRAAMNAIRPYAAGNKAYQDFLKKSESVEQDLLAAQQKIADLAARAAEFDRNFKLQQMMQSRLAGNPRDTVSADKLVRLYINELDDPKAMEAVLPKASAAVQSTVALLKKPVSQLTAAEASTAAQWCNSVNDNPASPNLIAMNIRVRVYCDAFTQKAKSADAASAPIRQIMARISDDFAKAQIDDSQVKDLTQSYIAALAPPPPPPSPPPPPPQKDVEVVVTSNSTPSVSDSSPSVKPLPPLPTPPKNITPPPEPQRQLPRVKVASSVPAKEEDDPKYDTRPTIFDFGRD
ncbi:MAG: hypothetical protein FWD61_08710 [Phycisphaerales bacterium]|nr:hypothetical protein [Phycisphaerales bacterium]